jgi:hypothetical protein
MMMYERNLPPVEIIAKAMEKNGCMSTGNLQMMTAFIIKESRYEASVVILSFTNMQSLQRTSKRT